MAVEVLWFMLKNGINAKRRADLETNDMQCVWLEITPEGGKSFFSGKYV